MAAGDTLIILGPYHNEPPATAYATLDTRNLHAVLDYDNTTDEAAVFSAVLPRSYAGGGLTVYLHWMATTAITGNVVWTAEIERCNTDLDADSFAAAQSVTDTCNGTSGIIEVASIAFTDGAQMDSLAAGEVFRIKVSRDADNGADTLVGDAELVAVEIRETPGA